MGSHSYLVNLVDINIGNNDGTIVIPSQNVGSGGTYQATVNGQQMTLNEGDKIDNVHGVVNQTPIHQVSTHQVPNWLGKGPKEIDYSVVNEGTNWCLDIGVYGQKSNELKFITSNFDQIRGDMPDAIKTNLTCAEQGYTVPTPCVSCPREPDQTGPVQTKTFHDADSNTLVFHAYWSKPTMMLVLL